MSPHEPLPKPYKWTSPHRRVANAIAVIPVDKVFWFLTRLKCVVRTSSMRTGLIRYEALHGWPKTCCMRSMRQRPKLWPGVWHETASNGCCGMPDIFSCEPWPFGGLSQKRG